PVSICHFPSPPSLDRLRRRGAEVARSVTHSVTPWSRVLHICSICQWLSAIGAVTDTRRTPQPAPGRRAQHSQHFSQAPAARGCPPLLISRCFPSWLRRPGQLFPVPLGHCF